MSRYPIIVCALLASLGRADAVVAQPSFTADDARDMVIISGAEQLPLDVLATSV